jgi:hypothetical protein
MLKEQMVKVLLLLVKLQLVVEEAELIVILTDLMEEVEEEQDTQVAEQVMEEQHFKEIQPHIQEQDMETLEELIQAEEMKRQVVEELELQEKLQLEKSAEQKEEMESQIVFLVRPIIGVEEEAVADGSKSQVMEALVVEAVVDLQIRQMQTLIMV